MGEGEISPFMYLPLGGILEYDHEELCYGKLKVTMPKFSESNDPKEYLSWSLKVHKIFRLHNYDEEKKRSPWHPSSFKTTSSFGGTSDPTTLQEG